MRGHLTILMHDKEKTDFKFLKARKMYRNPKTQRVLMVDEQVIKEKCSSFKPEIM